MSKSTGVYEGRHLVRLMDARGEYRSINTMTSRHIVNSMALWQGRLTNLYNLAKWNDSEFIQEAIEDLEKVTRACNAYLKEFV